MDCEVISKHVAILGRGYDSLLRFYVNVLQTWQTAYLMGIGAFIGGIETGERPFYWFAVAFFVLAALEDSR